MSAHPKCLAVWQAMSSDTMCRVCGDVLPEWTPVLFGGTREEGPKDIEVTVGSVTKKFSDEEACLKDFQKHIRRAFSLKAEDIRSSDVTFDVSIPDVDYTIKLRGWDHFQTVFGHREGP
jgi:hypothetical protein